MKMKKFLILCILFAGCTSESNTADHESDSAKQVSEQPKTYLYEPAMSGLEGKLETETFWGPPGYGEDTLNDSKELCTVLILKEPIDVMADSTNELEESIRNVKKIQLASNVKLDAYIGKRVLISGKLFSAQTGHHHTDVLMDVQKVEAR